MDFEKRNNIYKGIMLVIITMLITFLITAISISNYYEKTDLGAQKILENTKVSGLDERIGVIRSYLDKRYLGEFPDEEKLIQYAIKGYVEGLGDEYTEYLTELEYNELKTSVVGKYVGIGVYMAQDKNGNIVVLIPIEGSPAEEAGLKTGDIILKVNGEECTNEDINIVANKVRGEEGTKVTLEILREDKTFSVDMERRSIIINPIKTKVIDNNIGYIKILSFDEDSCKDFEKKLDELLSENITSLIIDVRDNGGGLVTEATGIVELFLPKDKIIMKEISKDSEEKDLLSKNDSKVDSNFKIVILENENSASASELLISALKENEIATIIGTKSFGKGVMQEVVPISTGGALKLTIEEFRTPNGNVIDKNGVEPNIEVKDDSKTEEDEQLQKAIEECKK